jgi:hypothetical protein
MRLLVHQRIDGSAADVRARPYVSPGIHRAEHVHLAHAARVVFVRDEIRAAATRLRVARIVNAELFQSVHRDRSYSIFQFVKMRLVTL